MEGHGSLKGRQANSDELPIPMVLKGKLRAQFPIPDSPTPSLASSASSTRGYHYTNKGYENTEAFPGSGHDYEDISLHLTVPSNGQRKHANPVYEPTPFSLGKGDTRRIRQDTERSDVSNVSTTSSDSFNTYHKDSRLNKCILVFILAFSVLSLAIVILMVLGVIDRKCACDATTKAQQSAMTSLSIEPLLARIRALERNMTTMQLTKESNKAIMQQKRILQLEAKLQAIANSLKKTSDTMERNVTGLESKLVGEMSGLRSQHVEVNSTVTLLSDSDKRKAIDIAKLKTSNAFLAVTVHFLKSNSSALNSKTRKIIDDQLRLASSVQKLGAKDGEFQTTLSSLRLGQVHLNATTVAFHQAHVNMNALLLKMNSSFTKKINELSQSPAMTTAAPTNPAAVTTAKPTASAQPAGGELSQCVFDDSRYSKASSGATFNQMAIWLEAKNKVLIGVSCSTDGGDEAFLEKLLHPRTGLTMYKCTCRGVTSSTHRPAQSICRISGWECPRS